MRFSSKPVKTNIAFNSSLRKGSTDYNVVSAAYYIPPLPKAVVMSTDGTPTDNTTTTVNVGSSGMWSFAELADTDGGALLSLKFRNQQIHTFLANSE